MVLEGKTLGGRYEVIQRVGGGGMAVVYLAIDRMLKRRVAIKVMNDSLSHDQDFIRRFHREARAAGSLSHPNIVNVYDVSCEGDTHYMVMEFIQGESLMEKIRSAGFIPAEEAARISLQILEGLRHVHKNGIIHRDVKPHNIMSTRDGRYKVTDFGVSRLSRASAITQTGYVMGSVHYFSPEQAKGTKTSRTSDLYSLGVVLFEMVTGCLPFESNEAIAIALKHIQDPTPDPRTIRPEIPEPLCQVIFRAMAKDPSGRYQSADEMIADLKAFLNGQPLEKKQSAATGETVRQKSHLDSGKENHTVTRWKAPLDLHLLKKKIMQLEGKKKWILAVAAALLLFAFIGIYLSYDSQKTAAEGVESADKAPDSATYVQKELSDSSGNSDSPDSSPSSPEEELDEYNWWADTPSNDSFWDITSLTEGTSGNYYIEVSTHSSMGQFYYDVIIADGRGERKWNTGQVNVPEDEGEFTRVEFTVSIPLEDLPNRGAVKVIIYSNDFDRIEHVLQRWG
ncbi:protein kinase domain-containing protein [Desmospora profundinema]|uniref:Serine/threonine protein kinase n=1 Tax=Desmospora profundinema TaxID=1571184 RepID=A0ABU1IML1_9BACL|nr:protein kinase [Desmospora profundinema]MDR6225936.1 serine/threonine protein kinase [Desmospora profundinema]